MGFLQYLLSHPQILVVVLFVVGPVLRSIFERLKRQAEQRQADIASERARIDALRTGGRVDGDALPAGVALERRAAERTAMTAGTSPRPSLPVPGRVATEAGTPAKKRRESGGNERRGPRVPGQSKAGSSVQQSPGERSAPRRPGVAAQATELADAPRVSGTREQPMPGPSALQRDAATREEAAKAAAGVALAASIQSNASWRRAIVMQELLMPPVSMR